ncbi:MAG: RlmE family RNA methyltransferase [Planctomycetota bacterium]|jgi:23S rRNA (uridine2552-2'-O)-methyltransferase|nr:RlmE family RNA methyltransferase [Planctomycetota bacterium]
MRQLHDRFFRQAKREGKLARSVYKLEEIDRRDHIFHPGDRVLDLGASPGSWLEYILGVIGPKGLACAVDLKELHPRFNGQAHFQQLDIRQMAGDEFSRLTPHFDVIVSDMAPNTSGIHLVDQVRSLELCQSAFALARRILRPGGNLLLKIFSGPDSPRFRRELTQEFRELRLRKPDACRQESSESYLVGLGFTARGLAGAAVPDGGSSKCP